MTDPKLPPGFRAAGTHCGIKKSGKPDLGLVVADEACPAHALFTQNQLLGAHIPVCHRHLQQSGGKVRAIVVNSGNANCATGRQGEEDAERVCQELAQILYCPPQQVLFMSTGVIGKRLPVETIVGALPGLVDSASEDGIDAFARAIMTTDTHEKVVTSSLQTAEGETVRICGVAKGAGMIHPDMATMLAFLFTDGRSTADLHIGLHSVATGSFHRLTIDGDTSPNDTVVLWTSNKHWCHGERNEVGVSTLPLEDAITEVSRKLCRMIARDGEGATRLITIKVTGAMDEAEAMDVGRFVATSPLVKTAIAGRDPNWGRILSAAASAGPTVKVEAARVAIGGHVLFENNEPRPENEAAASEYMRSNDEIVIDVHLGVGPFDADAWTCDFTADYVRINADYRT